MKKAKITKRWIALVGAVLVAAGLLLASQGTAEERVVSDQDASQHVGEHVALRGVVADVFISRRGDVFLNFGSRYPHQTFTAVIFRSSVGLFDNPKQWKGQKVIVRGSIKLYKGKPEIILTDPGQLSPVQK